MILYKEEKEYEEEILLVNSFAKYVNRYTSLEGTVTYDGIAKKALTIEYQTSARLAMCSTSLN